MIIGRYAHAAGVAISIALFAACGDDVTEVTNVSGNASLDQIEKFKQLPKCKEDVEGTVVFVKDSAKVFGCTSDGWIRLNGIDGVDGKKGQNGKDGKDGSDGAKCSVKQNKSNGFDVVCDGKKIGTLENGSDGDEGCRCELHREAEQEKDRFRRNLRRKDRDDYEWGRWRGRQRLRSRGWRKRHGQRDLR